MIAGGGAKIKGNGNNGSNGNNGRARSGDVIEQGWSKLSRFWTVRMRRRYVRTNLARRQGECRRCTLCCKLFLRCPFLKDDRCSIYGKRFNQCRAFPIDQKDVDLIQKLGGECGFGFKEGED